jgi:CSLREA domain-containing protein
MIFIFGLMLIGLAASTISRTDQVVAAPAAPTFTVNSFSDAIAANPLNNGVCETAPGNHTCTLRAAIMKANHYSGGGVTINLQAGTYVLTRLPSGPDDELTGDLNVTSNMTITGVSAASTIIDANQIDRIFYIGADITLSKMTIRNGKASSSGGGIALNGVIVTLNDSLVSNNSAQFYGGGIDDYYGTLTLNHSTISTNHAGSDGGGIDNTNGTLTLNNSTISNNSNTGASSMGGGISNFDGTLTLNNSTLSNNSTPFKGGGLYTNATVNVYYTTIVGNLADSDANGSVSSGGGIYNNAGTVNLKGSLLAQNYSVATPEDCNGTLTSIGYNLIQSTSNCTIIGVPTGNVTGVADPLIDSLKNNGGSTLTRALLVGSPAIDAIPIVQCNDQFAAPLTVDQRGFPRPNGSACDIGAYEGSLPMPLYNRNLIRNGDAEAMAGSPTGAKVGLPNWARIYSGTLIAYGASGGFPTITDTGPLDRGFGFFAGGKSAISQFTQTVALSSIGAAIDAGKVHYDLSGYLGGYATDDDYSVLRAKFLDAGHGLISDNSIGLVYASDRISQTGLLFRGTTGLLPIGTRFIDINLSMVRLNGFDNDGYADNLSLVLWQQSKVFLPLVLK